MEYFNLLIQLIDKYIILLILPEIKGQFILHIQAQQKIKSQNIKDKQKHKQIYWAKMSLDILHNELIKHYRKNSLNKQQKSIKKQSVIKHTYVKKSLDSDKGSKFEDFLKNQSQITADSEPLSFRDLPRNLKVYFPGPPPPPPKLQQTPYTYEIVPIVPFRMPKQKKGKAAEWVAEQSYFIQSNSKKSKEMFKKQRVQNHQSSDVAQRFRAAVKYLAKKMRQENLSLKQIIANKDILVKKPHNFYNSKQYFGLIKKGDKQSFRLLEQNPYLAFDIDDLKMTSLHWAARAGYAQIVNVLTTKYRSNTLAKDVYGRTPLHLAVVNKHTECIIRIFIQGGKLSSINNSRQSVKSVSPDVYTKFLLQKLQEIRFVIRGKGIKDINRYKTQLQNQIRQSLDSSSLYF